MSDRTSPETETLADKIVSEMHSVLKTSWDRECLRAKIIAAFARLGLAPTPDLRLRELLEFWSDRTRLQTFEDRERFRKAAGEALASQDTSPVRTKADQ
jgi:hypothetical protein